MAPEQVRGETGDAGPAADVWRGAPSQFSRAGFEVAARRKPARPIMRRRVE